MNAGKIMRQAVTYHDTNKRTKLWMLRMQRSVMCAGRHMLVCPHYLCMCSHITLVINVISVARHSPDPGSYRYVSYFIRQLNSKI